MYAGLIIIQVSFQVEYFHDGSDTLSDTILFEVKFIDQSILPQYLQVPYTFNLSINVNPMNDPPVVNAPAILRMAKVCPPAIYNFVIEKNFKTIFCFVFAFLIS